MPRVCPPIEGRQNSLPIAPSIVESVAGFSAGVVSTLVVHPFDVVKLRLQIEQRQNVAGLQSSSWRAIRTIASEGTSNGAKQTLGRMAQNFYRGIMPNMVGNSTSWALYFLWYGRIKDSVRKARGLEHSRELATIDYFLASGGSGILTAVATNPIWVIKTRMLSTARDAPGAYRSIAHGASAIYKAEGWRGFYRGLVPSLLGVSHGAIQFAAYEQLKNRWGRKRGGKAGLTNIDYLSMSAASKIFAGSITYPYQVVRSRLQTYDAHKRYSGVRDVVRQVYREQGLMGFYRG